jgi:hypothetical protein
MLRLVFYVLAWAICNLLRGACMAGLAALLAFYAAIGPLACVYVGARLGSWCGFDFAVTSLLMLAGLWLFGSIRIQLYRHVLRWWRRGFRFLDQTEALQEDLWRQYRDGAAGR